MSNGNGNGNGMTVWTAKIVLGIAQAVILALVLGIGTVLLKMRDDLVIVKVKVEYLEHQLAPRADPSGDENQ